MTPNFAYVKKPVQVEAFRLEDPKSIIVWPNWFIEALINGRARFLNAGCFEIHTLEGVMKARVGDWIIKGVKNEIYPCKDEIFMSTYDSLPNQE